MSKQIQYIVTGLLLTSYIFVGAVAHLEGFGGLFSFDNGPHKVERGRPPQPPPTIVCWNQYKHIPSSTDGPPISQAVINHAEWPRLEQYTRISTPEGVLTYRFRINVRLLSRAPPRFVVAS
jgi:hypothetical protein